VRYCPPGLAASAVALAAVATLAGCGSGAHYVANRDEDVYLKLPDDWTALDVPIEGADAAAALPWQMVVDGAGEPSADHFDEASPAEPVGRIIVSELAPQYRDGMSLTQLRALALGTDPLSLVAEEGSGVEILGSLAHYEVDGNFGNRIRFKYTPEAGGPEVVMEQVAVTDPGLTRIYVVQMTCELACFEDHLDEIEQINESFHIGAS
jgi:hypothetical protein